MVKEDRLVQTLKDKGLSCAKLKSLEKREFKESQEFRKIGFNEVAQNQEKSARSIRALRKRVCKLR